MSDRSEPRFIVRDEDGTEVPVGSVDELEERVAQGAVGSGAELYDASTDAWRLAVDVPVFQFILEELAAAGRLPPELESVVERRAMDQASPSGSEGSEASSDEEAEDPFEFQMELVDPESPGAPPGRPDRQAAAPDSEEPDDFALEMGRGITTPARGDEGEETDTDEEEESWFTPAEQGGIALPDPREPPLRDASVEGEDSAELWEPEGPDTTPPPPPPVRRRMEIRPRIVVPFLLVAAGIALWIVLMPSGDDDLSLEPISANPGALELPPAPPYPPGLADAGEEVLAGISAAFLTEGDALRSELALPEGPPQEWLSGYYLANAGEFPGVSRFWEGYVEFVDRLRARDVQVYMDGVSDALEELELSPDEAATLEAYFRERFQVRREYRQQRYDLLIQAAGAAVQLHDLLERHQNVIRHSPATGGGLSADPIFEAAIPEGPVRRGVDIALDRIFASLDRSRGGGAPSTDGLRTELFRNFGDG